MNFIREIWHTISWKHNPYAIFFQAGPLFVLAMCLETHYAILQIRLNHDWVYLWILLAGIALLLFALSPIALREYNYRKYVRHQESHNA